MGDTTTHLITHHVTSYYTIRIVTRLRMRGDDLHARPYVATPFLAPVEQREKQGSKRLCPINYKNPAQLVKIRTVDMQKSLKSRVSAIFIKPKYV